MCGFLDGEDADFFFDEVCVIKEFSERKEKKKKKKQQDRAKKEDKKQDSGLSDREKYDCNFGFFVFVGDMERRDVDFFRDIEYEKDTKGGGRSSQFSVFGMNGAGAAFDSSRLVCYVL